MSEKLTSMEDLLKLQAEKFAEHKTQLTEVTELMKSHDERLKQHHELFADLINSAAEMTDQMSTNLKAIVLVLRKIEGMQS